MINAISYRRVAEELRKAIEDLLGSVGLLCRVFGRGKSAKSLKQKIEGNAGKYGVEKKLIQDAVGIRVVVYFPEDISIVEEILRSNYACDDGSCTVDTPDASVFSVTRHNLIFRVPSQWIRDMQPASIEFPVDATFEVQLRTILSEGWHEVEHDLRYKRQNDWIGNEALSRNLNGVVATLETAEWSMRKIFDDLAYRQYKAKKWEAMLHSALRMRVTADLSPQICGIIDGDPLLAKDLYRINRATLFRSLAALAPKLPLTLDNLIYLWNFLSSANTDIKKLTPQFAKDTFIAAQLPALSKAETIYSTTAPIP